MACTGTGNTVNFKNNCLLCLLPEDPNKMLDILRTNPKNLRTFQPIVHYLTGTDPTYGKSQEECKAKDLPVMSNLPPMCSRCYDLTADIYRLHAELLEIQMNVQKKTEEARRIVSSTRKIFRMGTRKSGRTLFLERLLASGMPKSQVEGMKGFVEKFHERIYEQGCEKVIFPSKPPPNYLPLPKLLPPRQAPIVLFQLPPAVQQSSSSVAPLTQNINLNTLTTSAPKVVSSVVTPVSSTINATSVNSLVTGMISSSKFTRIAPAPRPPLVAEEPSPNNLKVADEKQQCLSGGNASSTRSVSTSQSSVVLVPGSQANVKYENEAEDEEENHVEVKKELDDVDDDDTDENVSLLQCPDVIVKDEVDDEDNGNGGDIFIPNDGDPSSDWEMDVEDNDDEEDEEAEEIIPNKRRRKCNRPTSSNIIIESTRSYFSQNPQQLITPSVQQPAINNVLGSSTQTQQSVQPVLIPMPIQLAPHVILAPRASLAAARNISTSLAAATRVQNTTTSVMTQPNQTPNKMLVTPKRKPPDQQFCDVCNESVSLDRMKPHLRVSHNDIEGHTCLSCQRTFISNSRLVKHWETRVCGKDSRMVDLRQEFLTCYTCPSPQVKFNLWQFSSHVFSIHESDKSLPKCHDCALCPQIFRTKHGLDFHINLHLHAKRKTTNASEYRTICPPQPLIRKKKISTDKLPLGFMGKRRCDMCQILFECNYLEEHLNKVHDVASVDLLKCQHCSFHCTKLESFLEHLKNNHNVLKEKPCHLCEKKFPSLDQLRVHFYEAHALGEIMTCEYCQDKFYDKGQLAMHLEKFHQEASNTNERAHKCPHCNQEFRQKGALNYHLRSHKIQNKNTKGLGLLLRMAKK